ncbi:Uncharacterised protein [Klebsiella quasipneumoniae]|nr:Uncharacterised protein [Klebsiella quasipneumoniae]
MVGMKTCDFHIANHQVPHIQLTRNIITKDDPHSFNRRVTAGIQCVTRSAQCHPLPVHRKKWLITNRLSQVFARSSFPACFGLIHSLCQLRKILIRNPETIITNKISRLKIWSANGAATDKRRQVYFLCYFKFTDKVSRHYFNDAGYVVNPSIGNDLINDCVPGLF